MKKIRKTSFLKGPGDATSQGGEAAPPGPKVLRRTSCRLARASQRGGARLLHLPALLRLGPDRRGGASEAPPLSGAHRPISAAIPGVSLRSSPSPSSRLPNLPRQAGVKIQRLSRYFSGGPVLSLSCFPCLVLGSLRHKPGRFALGRPLRACALVTSPPKFPGARGSPVADPACWRARLDR